MVDMVLIKMICNVLGEVDVHYQLRRIFKRNSHDFVEIGSIMNAFHTKFQMIY